MPTEACFGDLTFVLCVDSMAALRISYANSVVSSVIIYEFLISIFSP